MIMIYDSIIVTIVGVRCEIAENRSQLRTLRSVVMAMKSEKT